MKGRDRQTCRETGRQRRKYRRKSVTERHIEIPKDETLTKREERKRETRIERN